MGVPAAIEIKLGRPKGGWSMGTCFLQGYGACGGKESREHFISETVLRQLSRGKTVTIGGLRWQTAATLQDIGIGSLQAKILCERHNGGLGTLDSTSGALLRALDAVDRDPSSISTVEFHGLLVERWFLKVLCGLVAARGVAQTAVPDHWKQLLTGQTWPEGWGLYCEIPDGEQIFSKDIYIETRINPNTDQILAGKFVFGGVCFYLVLGKPDIRRAFGAHRPSQLVFRLPEGERYIRFLWPAEFDDAVIFTKIGTTSDLPAHVKNWNV
jgi:hypothetical protein